MSFLLEQLRSLIEGLILSFGYLGLALMMLLENVFPPVPSELVLPFAGSLVAQGELELLPTLVATTAGAVLGTLLFYCFGRWWGEARVRALFRRYGRWALLSEEDFEKAMSLFRRYDRTAVFWARLLPGVRSLISIPAGVARMPLGTFLLFTTLGTLLWNSVLGLTGFFLGQNWPIVLAVLDRYETIIWLLFGGAVAFWLVRRARRQRAARRAERSSK